MPKIKLGTQPTHFKYKVKVVLLDGSEGVVEMRYKYRTRSQFGEFLDQMFAAAKVPAPSPSDDAEVSLSIAEALSKTRDTNAQYILDVADGWDLESEFNMANVTQLSDELPGVAVAIINTYRNAIMEGRLGN